MIAVFFRIFCAGKKHLGFFIPAFIAIMGFAYTQVLVSLYFGRFIDKALDSDMDYIISMYPFLIALILLSIFLLVIQTIFSGVFSIRNRFTLRGKTMSAIIQSCYSFFERRKTGDLISCINNDLPKAENLNFILSSILKSLILAVFAIIYAFKTSWEMTLIMVFLPLFFHLLMYKATKMDKLFKQMRETMGQYAHQFQQIVDGNETIKAFDLYPYALKKSCALRDKLYDLMNAMNSRGAAIDGLAKLFNVLQQFALIGAGAWLSINGEFTVGGITFFLSIAGYVRALTRDINFFVIRDQISGAKRILGIWDEKPEENGRNIKVRTEDPVIKIENLTFRYENRPDVEVLQDISLSIKKGQKIALVGESGSGKSTLLKLLCGFYPLVEEMAEGQITLNGISINKWDKNTLHRRISMLSQETFLFNQSIKDNILLGAQEEIMEEKKGILLDQVIVDSGLKDTVSELPEGSDTLIGEGGHNFSGGERQRLGLSRVLIGDVQVLLLDEPVAALDEETIKGVEETLDKTCEEKTVLHATHRISSIISYDRIYLFEKGRIIEDGTHRELLIRKGTYYRYAETQGISGGKNDEKRDI